MKFVPSIASLYLSQIHLGQVVIVVTSNNAFNDSQTTADTATSLAFSTLQPSQLTSLAQGSFDTCSTSQTLTLIPQTTETSAHTNYLTTQGQSTGGILTMLQPGMTASADTEVIGVVTDDCQIQTADATEVQSAGLLEKDELTLSSFYSDLRGWRPDTASLFSPLSCTLV